MNVHVDCESAQVIFTFEQRFGRLKQYDEGLRVPLIASVMAVAAAVVEVVVGWVRLGEICGKADRGKLNGEECLTEELVEIALA